MSELKAKHVVDVYFDECDDPLKEYSEVYIKADADQVIAEKDAEIQRLEKLCESYRIDCDNLAIREANAYKDIERDNKQIRHHKYKRCLAMARWCNSLHQFHETIERKVWLHKWENHWLKMAEQFKEGK